MVHHQVPPPAGHKDGLASAHDALQRRLLRLACLSIEVQKPLRQRHRGRDVGPIRACVYTGWCGAGWEEDPLLAARDDGVPCTGGIRVLVEEAAAARGARN